MDKLKKDLEEKLASYVSMHERPAAFVAQYYQRIKSRIEADAEALVAKLSPAETAKLSEVNRVRSGFNRILMELEVRTLGRMPQPETDEACACLSTRIEQFGASSSNLVADLEDAYLELAVTIIEATNRLERRLLGEQTLIYVESGDEMARKLGRLVYFGEDYLNSQQVDCLARLEPVIYSTKSIHEEFTKSLNKALLVPMCRAFVLTKNHQIVARLADFLSYKAKLDARFYYVGKSKLEYTGYTYALETDVASHFVGYQLASFDHQPHLQDAVGVDASTNLFEIYSSTECKLKLENMRLKHLDAQLLPSPVERLAELELTNVHLDAFDTELLAECTCLRSLSLHVTFSDESTYEIGFLAFLSRLESLSLTLPDSAVDFGIFAALRSLRSLELASARLLDGNRTRLKLTGADFKQLTSLYSLESLKLSCFEIDAIDAGTLRGFAKLKTLRLDRNRIGRIDNDSFRNCSSGLIEIQLENNEVSSLEVGVFNYLRQVTVIGVRGLGGLILNERGFRGLPSLSRLALVDCGIEYLPRGAFDALSALRTLSLARNRIRLVRSEVFGALANLTSLVLSSNPLEAIEDDAFVNLTKLESLVIDECRLETVSSPMFNGLKALELLSLRRNQIKSIEAVTNDGQRVNLAGDESLASFLFAKVEMHMFKDLKKLKRLDLSGNKLRKLDLNCFCNLDLLTDLDLGSNRIEELSEQLSAGQLPNLIRLVLKDNQLTVDLAGNRLRTIRVRFLSQFPQLDKLDLSRNALRIDVNSDMFRGIREVHVRGSRTSKTGDIKTLALRQRGIRTVLSRNLMEHLTQFVPLFPAKLKTVVGALTSKVCLWKSGYLYVGLIDGVQALDLSSNLIKRLNAAYMFAHNASLESIDLSRNQLNFIHPRTFNGLSRLQTIDLSRNKLVNVDFGTFRGILRLAKLDLSANGIEFLDVARLLRVCPTLESLLLAENKLDERSVAGVDCANRLEELNLAGNRLESVEFLASFPLLRHLDLNNNSIQPVDSTAENVFGRLVKLTYLDLSRNAAPFGVELVAHLNHQLEYLSLA